MVQSKTTTPPDELLISSIAEMLTTNFFTDAPTFQITVKPTTVRTFPVANTNDVETSTEIITEVPTSTVPEAQKSAEISSTTSELASISTETPPVKVTQTAANMATFEDDRLLMDSTLDTSTLQATLANTTEPVIVSSTLHSNAPEGLEISTESELLSSVGFETPESTNDQKPSLSTEDQTEKLASSTMKFLNEITTTTSESTVDFSANSSVAQNNTKLTTISQGTLSDTNVPKDPSTENPKTSTLATAEMVELSKTTSTTELLVTNITEPLQTENFTEAQTSTIPAEPTTILMFPVASPTETLTTNEVITEIPTSTETSLEDASTLQATLANDTTELLVTAPTSLDTNAENLNASTESSLVGFEFSTSTGEATSTMEQFLEKSTTTTSSNTAVDFSASFLETGKDPKITTSDGPLTESEPKGPPTEPDSLETTVEALALGTAEMVQLSTPTTTQLAITSTAETQTTELSTEMPTSTPANPTTTFSFPARKTTEKLVSTTTISTQTSTIVSSFPVISTTKLLTSTTKAKQINPSTLKKIRSTTKPPVKTSTTPKPTTTTTEGSFVDKIMSLPETVGGWFG